MKTLEEILNGSYLRFCTARDENFKKVQCDDPRAVSFSVDGALRVLAGHDRETYNTLHSQMWAIAKRLNSKINAVNVAEWQDRADPALVWQAIRQFDKP